MRIMLDKNNPEWTMWTDIFQWRKKWYKPKNDDEVHQATNEGIALGDKYGQLAQNLIVAMMNHMAKEYKERNEHDG